MTSRRLRRRYPNYALKHEQVTRIITQIGLEQARREADAQAEEAGRNATTTAPYEREERDHA